MSTNKKLALFTLVFFILISLGNKSYAGSEILVKPELKEDITTDSHEEIKKMESSPAYKVLGRKLTTIEEKNYGSMLTEEDIKLNFLYREQNLVTVRALIAIGEVEMIEDVVEKTHISGKSFLELISFFSDLKEKYGKVYKGVLAIYVSNIKDDEYAYKQAIEEAYSNVFCEDLNPEDELNYIKLLKEKDIINYSDIVSEFQSQMSDDVKKKILYKILKEIKRNDLKTNEVFVKKIIGQSFTCENLRKILKEI